MNEDYDSPWKDVLDRYFPDFLAFFFPEAQAGIDWSRGWESLDTELQQHAQWALREASDNPLIMVMAHLQTQVTGRDPKARSGKKNETAPFFIKAEPSVPVATHSTHVFIQALLKIRMQYIELWKTKIYFMLNFTH